MRACPPTISERTRPRRRNSIPSHPFVYLQPPGTLQYTPLFTRYYSCSYLNAQMTPPRWEWDPPCPPREYDMSDVSMDMRVELRLYGSRCASSPRVRFYAGGVTAARDTHNHKQRNKSRDLGKYALTHTRADVDAGQRKSGWLVAVHTKLAASHHSHHHHQERSEKLQAARQTLELLLLAARV